MLWSNLGSAEAVKRVFQIGSVNWMLLNSKPEASDCKTSFTHPVNAYVQLTKSIKKMHGCGCINWRLLRMSKWHMAKIALIGHFSEVPDWQKYGHVSFWCFWSWKKKHQMDPVWKICPSDTNYCAQWSLITLLLSEIQGFLKHPFFCPWKLQWHFFKGSSLRSSACVYQLWFGTISSNLNVTVFLSPCCGTRDLFFLASRKIVSLMMKWMDLNYKIWFCKTIK
jgi:hypothetical protein